MLNRTLTYNDLLFISIGNIIGGGVFSLMGRGINYGKGYTWLLLLLSGMVMYIMSKAYTDIKDKIIDNESEYNISKEFGKKFGIGNLFASTYSMISVLTGICVATTISLAFAEHIDIGIKTKYLAIGTLILVGCINSLGIRESTTVINSMTIIEMLSLFVLMIMLPFKADYKELTTMPNIKGSLMVPLIMIFAFTGAEALPKLAGETIEPNKIPMAIDNSIGITTIMYAMTCATMISVLKVKGVSQSVTPMLDTYSSLFGKSGKYIINGVALFSIFNTIMMSIMSSSRSLYGFGKKKKIKELTYINKRKVPLSSIILCTLASIVLLLYYNSMEKLAILSNIFVMFMLIVINSVAYDYTQNYRNIASICIAIIFILFGYKTL